MTDWRSWLQRASQAQVPSRYLRKPPSDSEAQIQASAVLVLVGLDTGGEDPALLLIKRSDQLTHHAGQYGFPGGMQESGDVSPESTALRETNEEVGLEAQQVETLGRMPVFMTASLSSRIQPVVALLRGDRHLLSLKLDSREVDEAFWVRLRDLQDPQYFQEEVFEREGVRYVLPSYHLPAVEPASEGLRRIWGATALMIQNFLERLEVSGTLGK